MNFRIKATAALAISMSFATSIVAATPALASEADCLPYHGTICLTDGADFGGRVWRQTVSQINGCRRMSADNFDNKASTALNNTFGDGVLFMYNTNNCTGDYIALASREATKFRGDDAWLNNRVSSIKFVQV
ncbi:hypothetical protein [Actinoplanes sp. NPDC049118]|uniref:hypothetical protein n=1 Tax=Actinoplanes sp. NPDC049118 TaxID=3155769 RepID=UPI003408F53D